MFQVHFGVEPPILNDTVRKAVDEKRWTAQRAKREKLGSVAVFRPEGDTAQNVFDPASVS